MRKRFGICGHNGNGTYCHRCRQAEEFAALAKENKTYSLFKKRTKENGGPVVWKKNELLAESKRLKGPQKATSRRALLAASVEAETSTSNEDSSRE
jgi:hypothetical protein